MNNGDFLVTGASSGIGHALVSCLLNRGDRVVGVSRRPPVWPSDGVQERDQSDNWSWLECDLADFSALSKVLGQYAKSVSRRVSDHGASRLKGVVLCHGYGDFGSVEQFSNERIERLVNTNLISHMLICRLLLPLLKAGGGGDLVFIGSESSIKAGKKGAVYCATKFGLRGFAQALRQESASANVRVSIVNPGMVDTPFFDNLDFTPGDSRNNRLQADVVANSIRSILEMPAGSVVDEVNISPLTTVIRNRQ